MAKWTVKYLENDDGSSPVEDWLNDLPKVQYKAISKKLILLEKCGNELKLPHSRSLKQGLFELRELSFGLRIYYCFHGKQIIVILHSGEKDAQQKDIKTARALIKKIVKEGI